MKKTILSLGLAIPVLGAFGQKDRPADQFKAEKSVVNQRSGATFKNDVLTTSYHQYLDLKEALVQSDPESAKKAAIILQHSIKEMPGAEEALKYITNIAEIESLAGQREAFAKLSPEMTKMIKEGDLSAGSIYLEYCPMADNNQGAYWLSNEKEIKNPYFGKQMLKCGMVKEIIE